METTHNNHLIPDNQPTEKTNEDYNQSKPNPADPNETEQVPDESGDAKIITEEKNTDDTNKILRTFSLFASLGQHWDNTAAHYVATHPAAIKLIGGKHAA